MKTTRKSVNVDTNYSVLCIIKNGAFDLGFINDIYVISNALFFNRWKMDPGANNRDIFMHAPSQWETTLQYNVVSHWLGWVHIQNDPCTVTVSPANTILVNIDGLHIWLVLQLSVGFHKTSLHYTPTGPWLEWYILKKTLKLLITGPLWQEFAGNPWIPFPFPPLIWVAFHVMASSWHICNRENCLFLDIENHWVIRYD